MGSGLRKDMEDPAVDGKLGKRHKSFAGPQVLVKRFVMEKPMQEAQSHEGLFLAVGTQGSWEDGVALGFPSWHSS